MSLIDVLWCDCDAFVWWYDDVCRCGHRRDDHIDGKRMCMGEVEVHT